MTEHASRTEAIGTGCRTAHGGRFRGLSTVVVNVASGGFDAGHDARLDSQRCRWRRYAFDSHGAHPAVYDAKRAAEPFCSAVNRWLPLEWFEQVRTSPGAARAAGAAGAPPATDDNSRGLSSA